MVIVQTCAALTVIGKALNLRKNLPLNKYFRWTLDANKYIVFKFYKVTQEQKSKSTPLQNLS